jgi:phage-related protein
LQRPYAAPLGDGIYELRAKTINGQFRFFYFFFDGKKIIITHGLHKKTRAIPRSEIKQAKQYRSNYLESQKRDKR